MEADASDIGQVSDATRECLNALETQGSRASNCAGSVPRPAFVNDRSATAATRLRHPFTVEVAEQSIQQKAVVYDRVGDAHYDTISAFIKSMRASDEKGAIYWLAKMLHAGEDFRFIARRIVIFASEDVGLADPQALPLAIAKQAPIRGCRKRHSPATPSSLPRGKTPCSVRSAGRPPTNRIGAHDACPKPEEKHFPVNRPYAAPVSRSRGTCFAVRIGTAKHVPSESNRRPSPGLDGDAGAFIAFSSRSFKSTQPLGTGRYNRDHHHAFGVES